MAELQLNLAMYAIPPKESPTIRRDVPGSVFLEFVACEHCGNEFVAYKSETRRFCSTGCWNLHKFGASITHGCSKTRLYSVWCGMKSRCYCRTTRAFEHYGGRGIVVCAEWRESFSAFREWALTNGYSDNLEIDRRETDGNYEPSNCRWATHAEQTRNIRKIANGKTSRFKGVSLDRRLLKWVAQIKYNGRSTNLGRYASEEEAAIAYNTKAIELFGSFAHLNVF